MSERSGTRGGTVAVAPSMLDLVRLSPRLLFPPGGRDLYRQVALLSDLSEGDEVLVVGSGNGVTLEFFVTEYGAQGSGVDFDEPMVDAATDRARQEGLADRLQYQHAPLDRLPYRDEIFDVTVGELGLTAAGVDPEEAVGELVRVTRPGGTVVVVQLVWKAPVDEPRRRVLAEHLGVRPLMLVEWKRILREAGLERLHTEDWTDEQTAFRPRIVKPFPDFAELFSLPEKIGILRRAWRRWGWSGVRTVLVREREVHNLLTQERILGLNLVKGVRSRSPADLEAETGDRAPGTEPEVGTPGGPEEREGEPGTTTDEAYVPDRESEGPDGQRELEPHPHRETQGLPLFGRGDEDG